jgi:CMP-N,N'-diacetyllegionaminic acid synthase
MISGKRVLAVVPARGGSKGVPFKNIRPICGVPMVALVGQVVAAVPEIDRAVVSTDHDKIARVAESAGLAAPFFRPEELSGDRIADVPVLQHALDTMERIDGCRYDIVLMLQPTSPLRTPDDVSAAIRKLVDESFDAVWTVSETDSKGHPLKQLTIKDDLLEYYDPAGGNIIARQQLTPTFHRNGVCYAITRDCLMTDRTLKGARTGALVLEGTHVSIDTEWDIELVEYILRRRSGAGNV